MFSPLRQRLGAIACACACAIGLICLSASTAGSFPLWPRGKDHSKEQYKEQSKEQVEVKEEKNARPGEVDQNKSADKENAGSSSELNGFDSPSKPTESSPHLDHDSKTAGSHVDTAASGAAASGAPNVPVEFDPTHAANYANQAGSVSQDPMAIYRGSGVNTVEERKIRQLAQEFESMQRVRLKLLSNLLEEMRQFELQTDPDAKAVLAKQDEINKLSALMANERIKLLLAIRDIMTFDEKQRLVEKLQRGRH